MGSTVATQTVGPWGSYLEFDPDFLNCIDPQILQLPIPSAEDFNLADVFEYTDGYAHSINEVQHSFLAAETGASPGTAPHCNLYSNLNESNTLRARQSYLPGNPEDYPGLGSPTRSMLKRPGQPPVTAGQAMKDIRSTDFQIAASPEAIVTDTEDSWNEDEHAGRGAGYYLKMKDLIHQLKSTPGAYAITAPIPLRYRQMVHLLAHIEHCSHMGIGSGKDRRVLIASDVLKDELHKKAKHGRRWNRSNSDFCIDPKAIKINSIPADLSQAAFQDLLGVRDTPVPKVTEYHNRRSRNVAYAEFDEAEDVAIFVDALQGQKLREEDTSGLVIQYVRVRRYHDASSTGHKVNFAVAVAPTVDEDMDAGAVIEEETRQFAQQVTEPFRDLSHRESHGYSSASSASYSSASRGTDYSSEASATKKRKRNPMITQGYPCTYDGCEKIFDYAGDRTKHERIHMPKDQRPFGCDRCSEKFLDAKDLRRHKAVHTTRIPEPLRETFYDLE